MRNRSFHNWLMPEKGENVMDKHTPTLLLWLAVFLGIIAIMAMARVYDLKPQADKRAAETKIKLKPLFTGERIILDDYVRDAFITPSMCIPTIFWLKDASTVTMVNNFFSGKEVAWIDIYPLFQDGNWDTAIRKYLSKSGLRREELESEVKRTLDDLFGHCMIRLSRPYPGSEELTFKMISEAKIRFPLPGQLEGELAEAPKPE